MFRQLTCLRKIQRRIRRRIATKKKLYQNERCAISLTPVKDLEIFYVKITEAGFRRAYCANTLYNYFKARLDSDDLEDIKWPVSRQDVTSLEVKRLENLLDIPQSQRVSSRKNAFWKNVFKSTLLQSLSEQLTEIETNILSLDTDEEREFTEADVADLMSSLVASMLYLFLVDKIKFRSFRNRRLRGCRHEKISAVFEQIITLTSAMNSLFANHDIELAWSGLSIVPIIRKLNVPSRLR